MPDGDGAVTGLVAAAQLSTGRSGMRFMYIEQPV